MASSFQHLFGRRYSWRSRVWQGIAKTVQDPLHPGSWLNKTNFFLAAQFDRMRMTCCVCGETSAPWYAMQDLRARAEQRNGPLRENLRCRHCRTWMRQRAMAHALLTELARRGAAHATLGEAVDDIAKFDVLDTDAFGALAGKFRQTPRYRVSSYLPDLPRGAMKGDVHNVNLEDIPFTDETFDIVLSSDVLEHVRRLDRTNAEIFRVLKPGGVHVFTAPIDLSLATTVTLVEATDQGDVHLRYPQYHGDPLSDGALAYRIFGADIGAVFEKAGFEFELVRVARPDLGIVDICYFLARRPL